MAFWAICKINLTTVLAGLLRSYGGYLAGALVVVFINNISSWCSSASTDTGYRRDSCL